MFIGKVLVLVVLLTTTTATIAQVQSFETCNRNDVARVSSSDCDQLERDPFVVSTELETNVVVTMPEIKTLACAGEIAISYAQSNTVAEVEGTIKNDDCAASSGSFTVVVITKNQSGELQTQEHVQPWQRDNAQPVTFSVEYPIGANVDLVRVRTSKFHCRCAE